MTEINFDEWRAEVDKYSGTPSELTEEQFRCIDYARNHKKPMPYSKIAKMFEKHFGVKVSKATLYDRYLRAKEIYKPNS